MGGIVGCLTRSRNKRKVYSLEEWCRKIPVETCGLFSYSYLQQEFTFSIRRIVDSVSTYTIYENIVIMTSHFDFQSRLLHCRDVAARTLSARCTVPKDDPH